MITFTKMQGIGNDFVMVDALRDGLPEGDLSEWSKKLNDRRFGIGGDGLILLEKGESAPFRMRMFNPDGSESEMCGNGVRCFAKLVRDHGHSDEDRVKVETGAGVLTLELIGARVKVDMGPARLTRGEIGMVGPADEHFVNQPLTVEGSNESAHSHKGTAVSMGNPHLVIFVEDVNKVDLERIGPILERHELFPKRVNVHFAQAVSRSLLIQRTWERGAGVTLACGTGACAVGVAAFLNGHTEREVSIKLPGGELDIEYGDDGRVFMTGPAETVFEGRWTRN